MGDVTVATLFEDWLEVDGVLMPRRTRFERPDGRFFIVAEEIEFGPVDPAKVAIPAQVEALLEDA